MLKRTATCGDLRKTDVGRQVTLNGWVHNRRDHGGVIFIDLRDRFGLTQIVFDPKHDAGAHAAGHALRGEWVIGVRGYVSARAEGMANPKLRTGEIEVYVDELEIFSRAETVPFEIDEAVTPRPELRLKHRYIDMRRNSVRQILERRAAAAKAFRDFFAAEGFIEVETPILTKSTPEGARDYLVPSRINPGQFYALPQSPQLFKQLLMIGGLDRYYQITRCFRDEDNRKDRQPEFTQIDVEMSFVDEDDVMAVAERAVAHAVQTAFGVEIALPIRRMTYREALDKTGTDAPDLRYDMPIFDITELAKTVEFKVFTAVANSNGKVKGLAAPDAAARLTRKDLDDLTPFVKEFGGKGVAWIKLDAEGGTGPIRKFLKDDEFAQMVATAGAKTGDVLMFVADEDRIVSKCLGEIRKKMAAKLGLIDETRHEFVWVTHFPMFERDAETGRLVAVHHPFTSPCVASPADLDGNPETLLSRSYDLVHNGTEWGGGSIRIHDQELQAKVFGAIGMGAEEANARFGFLLDALKYGTPPHGGIAFGFDRIVCEMLNLPGIAETIAFPKTQKAACPLTGAPGDVDKKQLRELSIAIDLEGEK